MTQTAKRPQTANCRLSILGTSVTVVSQCTEVLDLLAFDFSYFLVNSSDQTPNITIEYVNSPPPYDQIPDLVESMRSETFVCFDDNATRFVDYSGRALIIYNYKTDHASVYATDFEFGYEKLYLMLLSRVGEKLDLKGFHRCHGLGFSYHNLACLFLIPSGGGKSTLAISLLEDKSIQLFSEDTPILDRSGQMHPFPLRLGTKDEQLSSSIPENKLRVFNRSSHGKKTLIHIDHYLSQIASGKSDVTNIFVAKWTTSENPKIVRLSKFKAFGFLIRDCVVGLGLPQVIEFFLTSNIGSLPGKAKIVSSRIYSCFKLITGAKCHLFLLCRDVNKNKRALVSFLDEDNESHTASKTVLANEM